MFSLVSDIIFDYLFIPVVSYGVDVVPAGPELASPEDAGDLRMTAEEFTGRDAFDDGGETGRGKDGDALKEEVNVIFIGSYLNEVDFVGGAEFQTDFPKRLFNRIGEYFLSVFGGADEVIQEKGPVMAFENVVSHGIMLPRSRRTPQQAAGNFLD